MTKKESLNQLNQYKSVLETTKDFSIQASASREQNGGEERCIQLFNKILLAVSNQIVDGLIDPLNVDANYSEISVACTQLLALLSEDPNHEDNYFNEDSKEEGRFGNLFEGFDNDFQDIFRDLGRKVRDNIPKVIKDKVAEELHRASEEIKKAEVHLRNSGETESNQAEYTEIVIEDDNQDDQDDQDDQNASSDSKTISMLKNQIEELKAELQATRSTVNQESEKKSESLSDVSIRKNIESVEIE